MTTSEMLAREIVRLDARGGRDTEQQPDFDQDAWPSDAAVAVALRVLAVEDEVDRRWARRAA